MMLRADGLILSKPVKLRSPDIGCEWRGALLVRDARLSGRADMLALADGVGVSGGELPQPPQEVADHQELVVGVGRQQVAGLGDEAAEDFPVHAGGGLG